MLLPTYLKATNLTYNTYRLSQLFIPQTHKQKYEFKYKFKYKYEKYINKIKACVCCFNSVI